MSAEAVRRAKKAQSRSFVSELVISMCVALSSFTHSLHFIVCKLQSLLFQYILSNLSLHRLPTPP